MPTFTPYNPDVPLRVYYRNLPHWRQPGATYFVTFRQSDSIPKAIIAQWQDIRARWFRAHRLDPQWLTSNPADDTLRDSGIKMTTRQPFKSEKLIKSAQPS